MEVFRQVPSTMAMTSDIRSEETRSENLHEHLPDRRTGIPFNRGRRRWIDDLDCRARCVGIKDGGDQDP
jgi:hypothetical protein